MANRVGVTWYGNSANTSRSSSGGCDASPANTSRVSSGLATWTGSWRTISSLTANAWNTVQVTVPANAAALFQLGVEVATTTAGWTGTIYVDSVGW